MSYFKEMVKRTTKTPSPTTLCFMFSEGFAKIGNDSVLPAIPSMYMLLLKRQLMEQIFRHTMATKELLIG